MVADSTKEPAAPLGAPFWRLFTSSALSNLSDGVGTAALPLLAVSLTRDPVAISALTALAFLPWLLLAIPAGALVDRIDRRRAMALANGSRAVVLLGVIAALAVGALTMPWLYLAAVLLGTAETVYDSAARAMLPRVVTAPQLERGNSYLATAESVGNLFAGAPIGAALFAVAAMAPFGVNAAGYALAAVLILLVRGNFRPERTATTSFRADLGEGLGWLLRHPILRVLMVTLGIGSGVASMTNAIGVLFALQNLGLSEQGFGLLLAVAGGGAVLGSLAAPTLAKLLGRPAAMGGALLVASGSTLLLGFWQAPPVGFAAFFVTTFMISAFNVQIISLRQALIPEALFGRVQGAFRTVIWGTIPLGSILGGIIGTQFGLSAVFLIAGGVGIVTDLLTWAVLVRHRAQIENAFAAPGQAPSAT